MTSVALGEITIVLAAAWAIDGVAASRLRPHLRHGLWTLVALRMLLGALPPGVVAWPIAPGTITLDAAAIPAAPVSIPVVPAAWWLVAWSIGAIGLAARWLVAGVRVTRRHQPLAPADREREACGDEPLLAIGARVGLRRLPAVFVDPSTPAPYVTGLWTPRLVLPSDWARWPAGILDHALAHELRHIARRDLPAEALWMLLACVYWFHPLAHVARRRAHESREMCCDADVAARLGPGYRITLLRVMAAIAGEGAPCAAAPGQHAWHPALARLHALERWSAPPPRGHRLAAGVLFVALGVVLLPARVIVVPASAPAVDIERLLDPVTRQELGMGSLHLRYALLGAARDAASTSPPGPAIP